MKILLTGARAPISADIARVLRQAGHQVWMSDSLRFPIGRFSPAVEGYIRLPGPRLDFEGFSRRLAEVCRELAIDMVVPTSEEVFWLSAVENLPRFTGVRAPSLEVLAELHDKFLFAKMARRLGYGAKENILLESNADARAAGQRPDIVNFVAKPVYSRFATQTILSPNREVLNNLHPTKQFPWMLQARAVGPEYCLYNLADRGNLLLHTAYQPKYRAGKGASVYFEPVALPELEEMAASFIAETKFTGQISFDVIKTDKGLVALECNPRGTSGAHLAAQNPEAFAAALIGKGGARKLAAAPAMLGLPMFLYNPALLLSSSGRTDFSRARDAMKSAGVPLYAQALATFETIFTAISSGAGLLGSTTHDIEWNGEAIYQEEDR